VGVEAYQGAKGLLPLQTRLNGRQRVSDLPWRASQRERIMQMGRPMTNDASDKMTVADAIVDALERRVGGILLPRDKQELLVTFKRQAFGRRVLPRELTEDLGEQFADDSDDAISEAERLKPHSR
jgi:hypothetical protein